MQLVRGNIKVQHGIYRIYEMLETPPLEKDRSFYNVAGYAIFDLKDQRLTKIFGEFQAVVREIGKLRQG